MLNRSLVALFIFSLLTIVVFTLEWSLRTPSHIDGAQRFEQLSFKFQSQPDSAYHLVDLPDNWDRTQPGKGGVGIYKADLELLNIPEQAIGFYLPKVSMNAEIFLNGVSIGSGGSMAEPVARYWNLPIYLTLPSGLWNKGKNRVEIRVYGFPNGRSGLGQIFVGENSQLWPHVESYKLKLMLLDIGAFSINLLLGIMLLVWASRTNEKAILYFAIGALFSCVVISDSFWINVPLTRFTWRWITHACIAFSVIFFYLFMLKMLKIKAGLFAKGAIMYLIIGTFVLLLARQDQLLPWAKWLHLGSLIIMVQLIFICTKNWIIEGFELPLWLGACMSLVLLFGLVDWIPAVFSMTKQSPYLYYIGPVAFSFAVSMGLLFRYVQALETENKYTETLHLSLAKQEKKLQKQHRIIMQFEKSEAVHEERDRIVRELHDGIGGQLMGALTLSENKDPELEEKIRFALDELRVIMDSLDPEADFLTMLGMFRQRIEKDLNRNNIKLKWLIENSPLRLGKRAEDNIHAMRIIQEAVTNIIKHAHATEISIEVDKNHFIVADNGQGMNNENKSLGRGMKNMTWRTHQIGAQLNIESQDNGTKIIIEWRK